MLKYLAAVAIAFAALNIAGAAEAGTISKKEAKEIKRDKVEISRDKRELKSDTAKLNAIVGAIELSSEAPVVRVDTVEREEGVDTLALHRSGGRAVSDERAATVHSKRTT